MKAVSFDTSSSRKLQKSQSFGFNSSSSSGGASAVSVRPSRERQPGRPGARSRSSSCENKVTTHQDSRMNKSRNIDPLASLPTSHTKNYHKNFAGNSPAHSPSPTQSEYDTCDPWDDY